MEAWRKLNNWKNGIYLYISAFVVITQSEVCQTFKHGLEVVMVEVPLP